MVGEIFQNYQSGLAGLYHFNKNHSSDVLVGHGEGADTSTSFPDSTGKHTMSAVSDAQVDTAQFKFGASSYLFQGTGSSAAGEDLIQTDSHADFAFGSSNFTIDCWVRYNATTGLRGIFRGADGGYGLLHRFDTDSKLHLYLSSDTSFTNIANAVAGTKSSWNTGQWYHIALTWDGSDYRLFVDGVLDLTVTSSTSTYNTAQRFTFGSWDSTNYGLNGWIDEVRVNKGAALWTGTFTPPSRPYVSYTDDSIGNRNGLATSMTFQPGKFGQIAKFNGTSGYISLSSTPDITSDFTVMFWANCDQVGSDTGLITKRDAFASLDFQIFEASANSGDIDIYGGGINIFNASGCRLEVGKWVHVAITRSGDVWTIYKNGYPTKTVTQATTISTGDTWRFGVLGGDAAAYYKGYMDEVAIYTVALTPKFIRNYYSWSLGRMARVV